MPGGVCAAGRRQGAGGAGGRRPGGLPSRGLRRLRAARERCGGHEGGGRGLRASSHVNTGVIYYANATTGAALWAANGYTVALVSRTASKLEAAAKTIPNAKPYPCDITDDAALRACLGAIARALGPIDDVIYNAGNGVWKKFDEISVDQLDAAMKTNVYGLLSTCQVATPAMIERGSGNVIVTGVIGFFSVFSPIFVGVFVPPVGAFREKCVRLKY